MIAFASPHSRLTPLAAAVCAAFCLGMALPQAVRADAGAAAAQSAATGPAQYTIVLKGAPVASYRGGVAGFAAAPEIQRGRKIGRVDLRSPQALAYVEHLRERQSAFIAEAAVAIGRPLQPIATMQHALNAVIVEIDEREAAILAQRADVELVERERMLELLTDRGPTFIGAPSIWDGSASGGVATRGEGMVAAVLDTGINWESPAFAATGPIDGYVHENPNGAGVYLGLCGPVPPNADLGRCNDKLIGMYDFTSTSPTRSATDLNGHGSHTASTVAGNQWSAPFGAGSFLISGVAPHANVVAFRVCTTGCPTTASSQAVNQAVIDGVDTLNFSISGGVSPWGDSVSIAFRNAVAAGVFVNASAGNDGPGAGTVNHVEPWVETVAASTKDNVVGFRFDLVGPGVPPPGTTGLPLRPAAPPVPTSDIVESPIVRSPNFADGSNDGCSAYPADTFTVPVGVDPDLVFADGFDGAPAPQRIPAVAVLALDQNASNCGSGARRTAALAAGAIGVIFVDRDFINLGANQTSWSMLRADWDAVWTHIESDPENARVSITLPAASFPQRGDVVSDYSSRGPFAVGGQFIVKPDITAPGTDILAAYAANAGGATATSIQNGTSMSGPHLSGAAVLLRAVRPEWSPTEVRSAINLTSKLEGLIRADGSTVDAWDLGSGRVDLTRAALSGIVLDESDANFLAANPGAGGDMSTLNLASIASANCATTCTFTRTLTSTQLVDKDYVLTIDGVPTGSATVAPATFTLPAGGTQAITVTIDGTMMANGWNFGQLHLVADDVLLPPLRMPIAIRH